MCLKLTRLFDRVHPCKYLIHRIKVRLKSFQNSAFSFKYLKNNMYDLTAYYFLENRFQTKASTKLYYFNSYIFILILYTCITTLQPIKESYCIFHERNYAVKLFNKTTGLIYAQCFAKLSLKALIIQKRDVLMTPGS